ncbi:MAG: ABC transporter substrate-binding protein [Acutalibacter sp.]|jgi:putative aldouronate transport system substrate-binding protein
MMNVAKTWKRSAAALLAALMVSATMSACNGGDNTSGASSSGTESNTSSTTSTSEVSETANNGEVVTLKVWGFTNASPDTNEMNAVAEVVNEMTRDTIGVEIELTRSFDYETLNLALTSGEKLDLVQTHSYSPGLSTMVTSGYVQPIDDLLDQYGQDIIDIVPEGYMKTGAVNGVQYGTPDLKDTARAAGFAMRSDVLDELSIDPSTITTWDDVHDVLVQVRDNYTDLYPLVPSWSGGGMQEVLTYDSLTVPNNLAVLEDVFTDSTDVVCLYETDSYREFCERMYQWNQEGLIMPDSTTTTDNNLMASVGFADYENIKPGKELEIKKAWNIDCDLIQLNEPYTYTGQIIGDLWVIPTVCENPDKAMQLLNMMYSDADLSNTLINGVEGRHWEWANEEHTLIKSPEGVDATASGYESLDWAWPNCRITPVWEGGDEDQWDQLQEFCDAAHESVALGFVFDTTNVMNQITACGNVVNEYNVALRWGELNPDEAIPEFISELKNAGVDDIVAECQTQLDAYLAENG